MSSTTPKIELHTWYRQYRKLKDECPDAILLYRLGDFYEVFDDDAKLVAELLEVTLTRKDYAVDKTTKVKSAKKLYCPMAGMPYHAVEGYVARLVGQGYRVAIAEQMSETPSSKHDTRPRSVFASGLEPIDRQRGVAHREIVRVITPGTIVDSSMLVAERNNYLAAVISEGGAIGLAYADLSTGEFAATECTGDNAQTQLESELARLCVAEVLVPDDETLRLPQLAPASAQLSQDLAPMTKEERDMVLPHERTARRLDQQNTAQWVHGHVTALPTWQWELVNARDMLLQQFGVQTLTGFGADQKPLAIRAAGAILRYVQDTQRALASQITWLRVYTIGTFMMLDPQTQRNLELLEGSRGSAKSALIRVLDRTRTPMGARLLRRWLSHPLLECAALNARHNAVECAVNESVLRAALRQILGDIGDMERAVNRLMQGVTVATPRDLVQLRQALRNIPVIVEALGPHAETLLLMAEAMPSFGYMPLRRAAQPPKPSPPPPPTNRIQQHTLDTPAALPPRVQGDDLFDDDDDDQRADIPESAPAPPSPNEPRESWLPEDNPPLIWPTFDPCTDVLDILEHALDDEPPALLGASHYLWREESGDRPRRVIRPGYEPLMDEIVRQTIDAQTWIETLEAEERLRTGIKSLKVDYNKVFGYYIEVPRAYSHQVPSAYERKQTLVNAERYITADLKEYESVVLNAQQRLVELEREAFRNICEACAQHGERLRATAQALARLDVVAALGEVAVRGRYVRPLLNDGTTLRIVEGRHPVVERVLKEVFVPNSLTIDTDTEQLLIISGANMSGKSTVLRQVALIVLLAQIGSFVPAERAEIGLVDRIFTRIGAQDDIATGQSTFMVEMTETAALLLQSTRRSLIILDEVGRGTSTYDGMAIARAIVEYIHNEPRLQCRTLFATHYHELTILEEILPRVHNYHMAALEQEKQVVFLYELRRGGADRSYGIHVAELAGIPRSIIHRATELLAELEATRTTATVVNTSDSSPESTPSLVDIAPNPVIEYLKRLNVNELTPIEAMTRLYELQQLARQPYQS